MWIYTLTGFIHHTCNTLHTTHITVQRSTAMVVNSQRDSIVKVFFSSERQIAIWIHVFTKVFYSWISCKPNLFDTGLCCHLFLQSTKPNKNIWPPPQYTLQKWQMQNSNVFYKVSMYYCQNVLLYLSFNNTISKIGRVFSLLAGIPRCISYWTV